MQTAPEGGSGERPLRVAALSELPTPYRWPLFQRVAAHPRIDLTLFFYSRTEADRDWGLEVGGDGAGPQVVFLDGKVYRVRGRRSLFFHWNPEIRQRLAEGGFDAVVIPGWSMPTSVAAALWCKRHRVPYVIFSETHARSRRAWWLRAAKKVGLRPVIGRASAWLATGSLSADFLCGHGARRERVFRFANTPDVETLAEQVDAARHERADVRRELGIPDDAVLNLFVGRLIGAKDPATLVSAQALVEQEADPPWLLFVGDGDLRSGLETQAREAGCSRIVFAGSRRPADLPRIFGAADTFVLPSLHEPWGVVVNEAMAARLPVILSDRVGAGADLLEDGRNGRLVPAGDVDALAGALRELAAAPRLRARMAEESAKIVAGWGYGPSVDGFVAAVEAAREVDR